MNPRRWALKDLHKMIDLWAPGCRDYYLLRSDDGPGQVWWGWWTRVDDTDDVYALAVVHGN